MKSKGFARNVSRDDMERGAADFGVDLPTHIQFVIDALKPYAVELGLTRASLSNRNSARSIANFAGVGCCRL